MSKVKLLKHEKELLQNGLIKNITHKSSSSIWLRTESSNVAQPYVNVYRVMGDSELMYLLNNKQLPSTQPYQAIVAGEEGRNYMEKYLHGLKHVDTNPTTVVEFTIVQTLYDTLFTIQHKIEDGVISIGLGKYAGNSLDLFNNDLANNTSQFKIVTVKRKN
jgi:hypothetical protein